MLAQLRQRGEAAFLSPITSQHRPLERALIGRFHTWDEAYTRARHLREGGAIGEFTVLRLPFSVELARYGSIDDASRALRDLGSLSSLAHVELGDGGEGLLLAGAFATAEDARALRVHLIAEQPDLADNE